MEIRRGWSSDYAKKKFDVTLDETDLVRILAEAGAPDAEAVAASMPTWDVYRILDADAMTFVFDTLRKSETGLAAQHKADMIRYRAERDGLVAKYLPEQEKPAG